LRWLKRVSRILAKFGQCGDNKEARSQSLVEKRIEKILTRV
jgi:hypothetical protein